MQEERYTPISSFATGRINKPVYPAELAKVVLSQCEVNPKKFKGIYSDVDIQRDIDWAEEMEKKFEPSPIKKYGDIFEAIVYEHGAKSGWFGANSQIIKTSRFDDYKNKIDLVVETHDEAGKFTQLALGVDVTFGSQDLTKKFIKIRDDIDAGKLGYVKYFFADRPKHQKFAGPLNNIPHVVVGTEVDRVTELGRLWMDPKKEATLATNPIQMTMLEEASLQLGAFRNYAAVGKSNATRALVPILDQKLKDIEKLIKEKRTIGLKSTSPDAVFEEIKRNLLSFRV